MKSLMPGNNSSTNAEQRLEPSMRLSMRERRQIAGEAVEYAMEHRTEFEPRAAAQVTRLEVEIDVPAQEPTATVTELRPQQEIDSVAAARKAVEDAQAA